MSETLLANPHFWTDRAEELRAIADTMRPGPQREQILRLADLDAAIAERARHGRRPLDAIATTPATPKPFETGPGGLWKDEHGIWREPGEGIRGGGR